MIEIPPHVVRLTAHECLDFADRVEWARLEGFDARRVARLRLLAIRERRGRRWTEEWGTGQKGG